jgi:hypothetical protein
VIDEPLVEPLELAHSTRRLTEKHGRRYERQEDADHVDDTERATSNEQIFNRPDVMAAAIVGDDPGTGTGSLLLVELNPLPAAARPTS